MKTPDKKEEPTEDNRLFPGNQEMTRAGNFIGRISLWWLLSTRAVQKRLRAQNHQPEMESAIKRNRRPAIAYRVDTSSVNSIFVFSTFHQGDRHAVPNVRDQHLSSYKKAFISKKH